MKLLFQPRGLFGVCVGSKSKSCRPRLCIVSNVGTQLAQQHRACIVSCMLRVFVCACCSHLALNYTVM